MPGARIIFMYVHRLFVTNQCLITRVLKIKYTNIMSYIIANCFYTRFLVYNKLSSIIHFKVEHDDLIKQSFVFLQNFINFELIIIVKSVNINDNIIHITHNKYNYSNCYHVYL